MPRSWFVPFRRTRHRSRSPLRAAPAFSVAPFVVIALATSAAAQQGAITGTIVDSETLEPVAGAQVYVPGTVFGTLTTDGGTYRLEGVPAGPATVGVRLIGYKEASQEVLVAAGQIATANFRVEQTALRLQDIVITGVVAETPRVKLPFVVERLETDDLPVPASDVSALLNAKASGVSTFSPSGQPGQATEITLRGPTSINAEGRSQAPLIVIDGVIQSETASLADIGVFDIDHIEIVKGAAAASLYGSRAQAGVIQITTKRGQGLEINSVQVIARGEFGMSQLVGDPGIQQNHPFVMNEAGTKFIDTNGNEVDYAEFNQNGNGGPVVRGDSPPATTFFDQVFPGRIYDNLDRFFDPGETSSAYLAVTGRFDQSSFRASVERYRETGIVDCGEACINPVALENFGDEFAVRDEGFRRWNARLNVDARVEALDVTASGFYSTSWQDNTANFGSTFQALLHQIPFVDLASPDEQGLPRNDVDPVDPVGNPLYNLAIAEDENRRARTMGSVDISWPITDWLTLEANGSFDRTDFERRSFVDRIATNTFGVPEGGRLRFSNFVEEAANGSVTASLAESFLGGDLAVRGKLRFLGEKQTFDQSGADAFGLSVTGVPNFGAVDGRTLASNELREIRAVGYFGIVGLDYKGRYVLDGLVRRDGSSLFGPEERWHTYFRGSAAWRISQEEFWDVGWIDELKLRFSIGSAGGRPNFFAQFESFGVEGGLIFPISLGNQGLKPEFSVEREAGLNLVLFDRLGLDLTYASATTDDQILLVPQPGFVGYSHQWLNAGDLKSDTWEASLRLAAIEKPDLGLTFRLHWDRTRAWIDRMDLPPYQQDGFRFAEGEPLGSYWRIRPARTCDDVVRSVGAFSIDGFDCGQFQLNDEGFMVFVGQGNDYTDGIEKNLWGTEGEVSGHTFPWGLPIATKGQPRHCLREHPEDRGVGEKCPLEDRVPVGRTQPDWNAAFATSFRYGGLTLSALLDAAVGFWLANDARRNRINFRNAPDLDQADKPPGLRKPDLYYGTHVFMGGSFMERGDWLKLRELALGYTLPKSVMERWFGGAVDRITLTAIGRDLFTITGYSGFDPEVGVSGSVVSSSLIDRWDFFQYPKSRTISVSLEVVF